MSEEEFDLVYRLLDLDLLDCEERRSGKIDDLELEGAPGETTYVSAIVTGTGALPRRLPRRLQRLGARVFGNRKESVPWSDVDKLEAAAIVLDKTAADLGLASGDRRLAGLFAKLGGN